MTRSKWFVGAFILGIAGLWSCGGETDSTTSSTSSSSSGSGSTSSGTAGGGGSSLSEYEQYCQADYDRDVKCQTNPLPTQVEACKAQQACDEAFFRDGVLPGIHKCVVERPCMMGDDGCYTTAADAVTDTASTMAFGTACTTKLNECTTAGTPFPDDYCFNYELVQDAHLDEMTKCFMNNCDMVSDCLNAVRDKVYMACPK